MRKCKCFCAPRASGWRLKAVSYTHLDVYKRQGIDGTVNHFAGIAKNLEENQRDYDAKFAKSFVRQLCNGGQPSRYLRGPAATGSGLGWAMGEAKQVITSRFNQDAAEYILSLIHI